MKFNVVSVLDTNHGVRMQSEVEAVDEDDAFDWFLENEPKYTVVDLWPLGETPPVDIWTKPPMDY